MIKAKHHKFIYPMFQWLTRLMIWRNFTAVHINGTFKDNGNAVLVLANHVSWWDGFWIMYLNLKRIRRKFYFMMLESQLKKYWYFNYSGGYSVKKKSRSLLESLDYSINLLQKKEHMVLIFPQGQIHSIYIGNVHFENGVQRIKRGMTSDSQILFVVNLIDYFSDKKPHLYMYIQSRIVRDIELCNLEDLYNHFYRQVSENQKKIKY